MHCALFKVPVLLLFTLAPLSAPFAMEDPPARVVDLDPLVISATRTPLALSRQSSAVTVLGRREIEASGARDLADLLEQVPALDVSRAGGPGGTATLRLRGMGDAQVLLLVDGVEQNDPSNPGRSVDLSTLPLGQVERVEIVRGPQSTLHGADAMAGVVHVLTRREPNAMHARVGVGSAGEQRVEAALSRRLGEWSLAVDGSQRLVRGRSAAQDPLGQDEDGLAGRTLGARVDFMPYEGLLLSARGGMESSRVDLDNFGGLGGDDPNSVGRTRRWHGALEGEMAHHGGLSRLALWLQDTRRQYHNAVDATHPQESLEAEYQGRILHAVVEHNQGLPWGHQMLAALEWEGEAADAQATSVGPWGPYAESLPRTWSIGRALVLQDQWSQGPARLAMALRKDWNHSGPEALTGRLSAGLGVLRASLSTGFKAPSLYQRHSIYGSPDLQAEESRGWDAGVDLHADLVRISMGCFQTRVRRQIEFGADWHYHNISRATHQGVEIEATGSMGATRWSAALQQQTSVDEEGRSLPRRPRTRARVGLGRQVKILDADLIWRWEGARKDVAFDPLTWEQRPVELGAAGLVDLRLRRRMGAFSTVLAVDNLFARHHQEVLGYTPAGRQWHVDLEWSR